MCLRTQRQAVRVTLKELESVSFDITSANVLKQLLSDLETLKSKYVQSLSTEDGLVLRTQATSSSERARKLKLKYKRLRQRTAPYGSLTPKQQSGRPRTDYRYRNSVGKKATNLRKVCNICFCDESSCLQSIIPQQLSHGTQSTQRREDPVSCTSNVNTHGKVLTQTRPQEGPQGTLHVHA